MPRSTSFLSWALAPALMLGLAGCELPSAAGDSEQPFTTPATANPNLPAPATEELAPLCPAPDPAQLAVLEQQINAERTRLGRSALTFRPELAVAAQAHACDMARMGRLAVAGSNGSSVVDRIRAVNYAACSSAQLIGQQGGATGQMAQWLAHKPDQEILVHNKFDDAGIGMVASGGRYWWSLVMADRCS
ncbi:CAP domain-containing protein [Paracoccus jeotgali]|uniref:CAP domain-containing protein n=1 Tax=Paracoccus jeotgali TaxID=2065379 RepID=UPI0028A6DD6F|nr:CAP domain-containing protein [Paracoccus jeotgali]